MAKIAGGVRTATHTKPHEAPAAQPPGEFPKEWTTIPPVKPEDVTPNETSQSFAGEQWLHNSWMIAPDGTMLYTAAINKGVTNNSEHADAAKILMKRAGLQYPKGGWFDAFKVAEDNGWTSVRYWVLGSARSDRSFLDFRTDGERPGSLKRIQRLVNKMADMGIPVFNHKIQVEYGVPNRTSEFWTGSFDDLMNANKWADLGLGFLEKNQANNNQMFGGGYQ